MTRVIYIEHDGVEHVVDLKDGLTVMEGAVKKALPGILAECGGACACATCHVYVDEQWVDRVGEPSALEASMLEFADGVAANSRLSCQIKVTPAIEGLIVRLPDSQS